jgi:hypothetical protein
MPAIGNLWNFSAVGPFVAGSVQDDKADLVAMLADGDARNDCMKDWLARWCGCHAVLFLSYLQKTKASYYMSAERSVKER